MATQIRPEWPEPIAPLSRDDDDDFQAYNVINPAFWAGEPAPERQWRLDGWLPDKQTTYLTGPGSAGKSLLGQQLATCVALGRPFLGIPTQAAPALYLSCEDDPDELNRRQQAICESLGVGLPALSNRLHLISDVGSVETALFDKETDRQGRPTGKLSATESYGYLSRIVRKLGVKLLVLDNTAHLFGGNENDRHEVAGFMALLNRLAIEMGGAVLLLGHPNKAGDAFSGSTAWENQVRSRLYLETPADSLDGDVRVLSRQKANYAPNGETLEFRWHRWAFVRECDLPTETAKDMAEAAATAHDNAVFLACLDERNRQERAVSEQPASRTYAPKVFADMAESKRIGRVRLEAAMDRLFRIGSVERGFVYRDPGEGKDRFGIRRASADLSADLPLTGAADVPLTARRPPLSLTPSTTYYPGAALEPAAPGTGTVRPLRPSMVLAPGETGHEPVPGLEDW